MRNRGIFTFPVIGNVLLGNGAGFVAGGTLGGTANVSLSGKTITFNNGQQIDAQEAVGGILNFMSTGASSNTLRETLGNPQPLCDAFSGDKGGFLLINGGLHPANIDLP